MDFIAILGIAIALAMDAFAVAVAASASLDRVSPRQFFRLSFHFGLFQAMMPILGWLAGQSVQSYIAAWDHWVAFALLLLMGLKAIRDAFATESDIANASDPTRGLTLVTLSVATSIDALTAGFSFAALRVDIWYPAAVIGVVTASLTVVGMLIGSRIGSRFGMWMKVTGGCMLIAIGLKVLASHFAQ